MVQNLTDSMKFLTYLIAEVLEVEGQHFALRHASDTKVEPSAIVLAIHVRACVTSYPYVEIVFLITSCST